MLTYSDMAAPARARDDYDYLIKLLLILWCRKELPPLMFLRWLVYHQLHYDLCLLSYAAVIPVSVYFHSVEIGVYNIDFKIWIIELDEKRMKLQICDKSHQLIFVNAFLLYSGGNLEISPRCFDHCSILKGSHGHFTAESSFLTSGIRSVTLSSTLLKMSTRF